ncbi:MAG: hypothetical protein JWO48_2131 [Bryobacterales bacterium]|nr:hypothetical protein [Bryobacterales bacterium]
MKRAVIACFTTLCALVLMSCAQNTAARSRAAVPTTAATDSISVIPAGTSVQVRTNEPITADSSSVGRTFAGEIAADVINREGQTLIPRGSPVTFVVMSTSRGGVTSGGEVQLGIKSINVNGRSYLVSGSDVEKGQGLGANRRTGEMVGGGAVLGTLIGAIAGGGVGAAVGAVAGAAAGAGAQVLTQGKEIKIPAESVLTFRLNDNLHLRRG